MVSSARRSRGSSRIALGDMDTLINIYERNQTAPTDVKYGLKLALIRQDVWSMNEVATSGVEIFDGANQFVNTATDFFTIHNDPAIRSRMFVEVEDILYEILRVRDYDKRNKEFITLMCVFKGSKEVPVNLL